MEPLSQDEFFAKLTDLFDHRKNKDHGRIHLTQKRLTYGQEIPAPTSDNALPDASLEQPLPLLIRATNGKSREKRSNRVKLSTVVAPAALDVFYTRYAEVCKAGMMALKPRDRTKRKAKAKKKKGGSS